MTQERRSIPPADSNASTGKRAKTSRASSGFALTRNQRAECIAKALTIAPGKVRQTPAYVRQRVLWMGQTLALARSDQDRVVKVVIDDAAITREEMNEARALVEHLRLSHEEFKRAKASQSGSGEAADSVGLTLDAMRAEIRTHQRTLLSALKLRYRSDPSALAPAREAVAQENDAGLLAAEEQLVALCEAPQNVAWLADAPKGEGETYTRMTALCEALRQRVHDPSTRAARRALKDARDRAWTLASATVERIRLAGRYLVQDDPARRRDYLQFESLRATRYRAKKARKLKAKAPPQAPPSNNG